MSKPWGVVLALLLAGTSSLASADSGHVTVLQVDPSQYTATSGVSVEARKAVARAFFNEKKNSDAYDFLVVFPGFDTILRTDSGDGLHTVGLHTLVRNHVKGIGKPDYDIGLLFGSRGRLKGYIDIGTLRPASTTTSDSDALQIIAHEVAHQWSGEVGGSLGLLGSDGAHWSFFLSSNASVLLGSEWRDNGNGTFTAVESRRRYSPLDLYLMGFMEPEEVPPFQLLKPGSGVTYTSTDVPPPAGTTIPATPATLEMENLLATLVQRTPTAAESQRDLRAAFILLVPTGQTATAAQLAHVESVRAAWENQFFLLTRGRSFMQTTRVDRPPQGTSPGVDAGLGYLLSRLSSGHWSDHPETAVRETQAALGALAFFNGRPGVGSAVLDAVGWLNARAPKDGDERARRLRGLALALAPDVSGTDALMIDADPLGLRGQGGRGYGPGYGTTVLDTALVGLALTEGRSSSDASSELKLTLEGIQSYLLAHQNGDGGWPTLERGPSRVETTALVLQFLARRPRTASDLDSVSMAANAAFTYLNAHRGLDGLYRDDLDLPSTTAEVALALVAWGVLGNGDGAQLINAFQAQQLADGSWEGSIYQTARVLQALRLLQVPNLTITNVTLSTSSVTEGEGAVVDVVVRNTGFVTSSAVLVKASDSDNKPFGSPQTLAPLAPGASAPVRISLDTSGHAGSTQLFLMVDSASTLDEMREDDNQLARSFVVRPAPAGVDLFVASGSVKASPEQISQAPQTLEVTARVGNAGGIPAADAVVSLTSGEAVLVSTTLTLEARSKDILVTLPVTIQGGPYPAPLRVHITQRAGEPPEAAELAHNNTATLNVAATSVVGLQVATLLSPGTVEQGGAAVITFDVSNTGTLEVIGGRVEVRVVAADGVTLATLTSALPNIASGQTKQGTVSWAATHAGTYSLVAQAVHQNNPLGTPKTASLKVDPSVSPELELGAGAITTAPEPALVGQPADIRARVRNAGAQAGSFAVDFYLEHPSPTPSTFLGRDTLTGLAPGESAVASVSFTPTSDSNQVLRVVVDPNDQVPNEIDEEDNTAVLTIKPRSIADLVLTDGDLVLSNAFPQAGNTVTVKVGVFNQGQQSSAPSQVELYLGSSGPGGTLIDQAPLAAINAGQRGEVTLSWSTSGLTGQQSLVAVVNREGVAPEQRSDNNRGERRVLMQSGAVALTEPYFSPNGDKVKDSTEVFYRLTKLGPSRVYVTARDGTRLRTFEVDETEERSGSVTWDGRDAKGKVVKDGEYRITVFAESGAESAQVGSTVAVVDTDGTWIDEVEDPALIRHAFFKGIGSSPTSMSDDTGIVYFSSGDSSRPCGFYRQPLLGGDPELLAPAEAQSGSGNCYANDYEGIGNWFQFAMSPEGSSVAFIGRTAPSSTQPTGQLALRHISRAEKVPDTLVTDGSIFGSQGYKALVPGPIRFQEDSRRVWFIWGYEYRYSTEYGSYTGTWGRQIHSIDPLNTADRRIEFHSPYDHAGAIHDFKLSPNGDRIAFFSWNRYYTPSACLNVGSTADGLDHQVQCQYFFYANERDQFDWVDDGKYLLTNHNVQRPASGGGYVVDSHQLQLYDVESRTKKNLLDIPYISHEYEIDFATHPHGDAAVYRVSNSPTEQLPAGSLALIKPVDSGTPRFFAQIPGAAGVNLLQWSSRGTFLHGRVASTYDGSYWAMHSVANLSARIHASRPPGSTAISLRGTAADLNFDSYTVAVRPQGSTSKPVVIAQRRSPVVDGVLATWSPPGPGMYEAVLTVQDKAGNSRTHTTQAIWSNSAVIANLSAEPVVFSPNGDNVREKTTVKYEASEAINTDFFVTSANGQKVRTINRSHAAGPSEFDWDGLDDLLNPVADGNYIVTAGRASTSVVVDRKSPEVQLVLGQQMPTVGKQSIYLTDGQVSAQDSAGQNVSIPSVRILTSWSVNEDHPGDEQLEALVGTESTVLKRGPGLGHALTAEQVRGALLRVRALDEAGNSATSAPPIQVPERLFLVGIGEASTLESGGTLRYGVRTIPRTDLLRRVGNELRVDPSGLPISTKPTLTPARFVFTPQRYAFALANTVGRPIVSYAVAYPSPVTGKEVIDYTNVKRLAEDAILWDARTLPEEPFILKILGTDTAGTTYSAEVPFDTRARLSACVNHQAGVEQIKVSTWLARGTPTGERLAPGALLDFIPEGGFAPEWSEPVNPDTGAITKEGLVYTTNVASSGLSQCRYTVAIRGTRHDGSEVEGSTILNVCGLFTDNVLADGSALSFDVVETFRQQVKFLEVYQQEGAHWRLATMLPGLNGRSGVSIPSLSCGGKLRLLAHLADGSVVDSTTQNGFRTCEEQEEQEEPACADLEIAVSRKANPSQCASQQAIYDFTIKAKTSVQGGWSTLEALLVTPSGAHVGTLPVNIMLTSEGSILSGVVNTGASSLAEGEFRVQLVATDARGSRFRKTSDPLNAVFVDRTLPVFTLATPADDEQLCPVVSSRPDGTQGKAFNFTGRLFDQWLESASLEIKSVRSGVTTSVGLAGGLRPERVSRTGILGKLDASALPPGSYTLTGSARDASGGSECVASRTFHVSDGVKVDGLVAEPLAFGPLGTIKKTHVQYSLDGPAKVTLSAISAAGKTSIIYRSSAQLAGGSHGLDWDGSVVEGEALSDGAYTLFLEAVDACGQKAVKSTRVVFDKTAPVARIDAPAAGTVVGSVIQVMGQATDANLTRYTLSFEGSTGPVVESTLAATGSLGTVSTAGLAPGEQEHTLVLKAEDEVGQFTETKVKVKVAAGNVIAGFALSPGLLSPNLAGKQVVANIALRQAADVELRVVRHDGATRTVYGPTSLGTAPNTVSLASTVFDDSWFMEGDYSVNLVATAGSLTETASAQLVLDRTKPVLTLAAPVAGAIVPGRGDVVGSMDDPHLASWIVSHGPAGAEVELARGYESPLVSTLAHFEGLPEGEHRIVLTATDAAGNSDSKPVLFTSDTTPPRVAFLYPQAGEYLSVNQSTGSKLVGGNVAGDHLSEVTLSLKRGTTTTVIGSAPAVQGNVEVSWSLASVTEGAGTLVWTASDLAGNSGSAEIPVVVDNTMPTATLTGANIVNGPPRVLRFMGTATDNIAIDHYKIELASGPSSGALFFSEIARGTVSNTAGLLAELPLLPADGEYTARLTVVDRAGNSQQSALWQFVIDTEPPAPPVLSANVEAERLVALSWTPSGDDSGIKGYWLKRAVGEGLFQSVTGTSPITSTSKQDSLTKNGSYRYVVIAIDQHGNESQPSNVVRVDLNPPIAAINRPTSGAVVSGLVEVVGSAYAADDFKEYRLLIGEGASASTFTQVLSSPRLISSDVLGTLDLSTRTDGATYSIRLEAEDAHGNVAKTTVSVKLDRVAPSAPVWASDSPSPSGSNVTLTWVANADAEKVIGYLVFRNGVLLNAPTGTPPHKLTDHLVTSTSYTDNGVPDGIITYELQAMDEAGNLSARSVPKSVPLNERVPVAKLVFPASMERLSGPVSLEAEVRDLDVTEVQFQVRAGSETTFSALGAPVKGYPYTMELDPSKYGSAALEVRAIARDGSGPSNVDPSPESVYYFRDVKPAAPLPVLRANGYDIHVTWTDGNPAGSVAGHLVTRDITPLRGSHSGPRPVAQSIVALRASSGDASAAYDTSHSTSWTTPWVSDATGVTRWEMQLQDAVLVDQISASVPVYGQKADLWVNVRGLWVRLARNQDPSTTVAVKPALEVKGVAYDFTQAATGGTATVGLTEVSLRTLPFVTESLPALDTSKLYTTRAYTVTAVSPFGLTTDGVGSITAYTPQLQALAKNVVATPFLLVKGNQAPPNATLEVFRNGVAIANGTTNATGGFEVETPLLEGVNTLTARAYYPAGSVSEVSNSLQVKYEPPPAVVLTLSSPNVSASKVSFAIAVSGSTSAIDRVVHYEVQRVPVAGAQVIQSLSTSSVPGTFSESTDLPNGTYRYTVFAVDGNGFKSAPSNTLSIPVEVAPPAAPTGLIVTAPSTGGRLEVKWSEVTGASSYLIQRAAVAGGPFTVLTSAVASSCGTGGTPTTWCYTDTGVTNGSTYYYRVLAVDVLGNPSNPSVVVSGTPRGSEIPEPPRLTAPTRPGSPLIVDLATTSISGVTGPGTTVALTVNGKTVGTTTPMGPSQVVSTQMSLKHPLTWFSSMSSDAQAIAYRVGQDTSSGTLNAVAVEELLTHEVQLLTLSGVDLGGVPYLSPDRTRVAVVGTCRTTGTHCTSVNTSVLLLGEVASKTWRKVNASRPDFLDIQYGLVWSPDSTHIAYRSADGSSLWVGSLGGVESIAWSTNGAGSLGHAAWMGPQRLAFIATLGWSSPYRILERDVVTSALSAAPLFESSSMDTRLLVTSPSSGRLLVHANGNDGWGLYLVDTATGSGNRKLTSSIDTNASGPVFSPDGSRVAYAASGQLFFQVLSISGSTGVPVGSFNSPSQLLWGSDGLFQYIAPFKTFRFDPPSRLDWGVPFTLSNVALVRGSNEIVAFASNSSGNKSAGSEAIELVFDSPLPDLTVTAAVQPMIPRMGEPANAAITVKNIGGGNISNVKVAVSVLGNDGSIRSAGTVTLSGTIGRGTSVGALVPIDLSNLSGGQELVAVVDPEQLVTESNRANNQVTVPFVIAGNTGIAMGIQLSSWELEAQGTATASVTVANAGAARELDVRVELWDAANTLVRTLEPLEPFRPLGANVQAPPFTRTVGAEGLLAGTYRVVARAMMGSTVVATAYAPLEILPDESANLTLSASRLKYIPGEPIDLMARVVNQSSNALLSGATVSFKLMTEGGVILETQSLDLPSLAPGVSTSEVVVLAAGLEPGTYRATAQLRLAGNVLASSETSLVVEGRPLLQGSVALESGTGEPPVITPGLNASVRFSVSNVGTAPAGAVLARLRVVETDTLNVAWTQDVALGTIAQGDLVLKMVSFPTTGLRRRDYVLSLAAVWTGAQEKVLSITSFRVRDTQVPRIVSTNLADGMIVGAELLARLRVMDDQSGVQSVRASVPSGSGVKNVALVRSVDTDPVDGSWSALVRFDAEGPQTLTFTASDLVGNDGLLTPVLGNPVSVKVVSDWQPPAITVSGVENGQSYGAPVSPVVTVTDAHLDSVSVTLDGKPFVTGSAVQLDGDHTFVVEALDKAGNQSRVSIAFKLTPQLDHTKPIITISGVSEGQVLGGLVTPEVEVTDVNLATTTILLDGEPWLSGMSIMTEGLHVLSVEASDRAGNTESKTVSFAIDHTPPTIVIDGVAHGGSYMESVIPVVTMTDPHLDLASSSITLDGRPFISGTRVEDEGDHELVVEALDVAGNQSRFLVSFRMPHLPFQVGSRFYDDSLRVLALLGSGTCSPPEGEVTRLTAFITDALQQSYRRVTLKVTTSAGEFTTALRSGRFNAMILVPDGALDTCGAMTPDPSMCRSITERVYSGYAGLIVINPDSPNFMFCNEVMGVSNVGPPSSSSVGNWQGPLRYYPSLTAGTGSIRFLAQGASPAGWYGNPQNGEMAAASQTFGQGLSISFGFDLSQATPSSSAAEVFLGALYKITGAIPVSYEYSEDEDELPTLIGEPLGVLPVQFDADNFYMDPLAPPVTIRMRKRPAPGVSVFAPDSPITLGPAGSGYMFEWVGVSEWRSRISLRYFLRLPDVVGEHDMRTDVHALLASGPRGIKQGNDWPSHILVRKTGADLLAEARTTAMALPDSGVEGEARASILQALDQVQARPIVTAADAEANLSDLYEAVQDSRSVGIANRKQMRLVLDRVISYWEARWSAL